MIPSLFDRITFTLVDGVKTKDGLNMLLRQRIPWNDTYIVLPTDVRDRVTLRWKEHTSIVTNKVYKGTFIEVCYLEQRTRCRNGNKNHTCRDNDKTHQILCRATKRQRVSVDVFSGAQKTLMKAIHKKNNFGSNMRMIKSVIGHGTLELN
jgi:hypothetical protein